MVDYNLVLTFIISFLIFELINYLRKNTPIWIGETLEKIIFYFSKKRIIKKVFRYIEDTPKEKDYLKAFKFIRTNKINGAYVEFGVASGKSMLMAYNMSRHSKTSFDAFIGFDSFEGMPEPKGKDKLFYWVKGDYKYSKEYVLKKLHKIKNILLIKGFYNKSFKEYNLNHKIAFVHIDCDYYESTKLVLNYIKKHLRTGTVIMFDDWYCFNADPNLGEQLALKEFLNKNKNISLIELPCTELNKMFIVKIIKKDNS